MRNEGQSSSILLVINRESITLSNTVKILEVLMDLKLCYTQHIAKAAMKGLDATMTLRQLCLVSSLTARQLFKAMIASVVDYTFNI